MGSRSLDVPVTAGLMEVADLDEEDDIETAGVARMSEYGIELDAVRR
jgi:hypothetical protein